MFVLMWILTFISVGLIISSRSIINGFKYKSKIYLLYKKYDKDEKLTWIICSILSLICIVFYLSFRWIPAIAYISKYNLVNTSVTEFRSANISIVFMLDLCSILGILLPLLVIFDWKKKILLKPLSILGILGGMATILFTTIDLYSINVWNVKEFFLGSNYAGSNNGNEPLMFIMHYWMIIISFFVVSRTDSYKIKDVFKIVIFIIIYLIYILIIAYSLNIKSHVTALVVGDYFILNNSYYIHQWSLSKPHPPYSIFVEIFGTNKSWIGSLSSWLTFTIITIIIILVKNLLFKYFNQKKQSYDKENKMLMII